MFTVVVRLENTVQSSSRFFYIHAPECLSDMTICGLVGACRLLHLSGDVLTHLGRGGDGKTLIVATLRVCTRQLGLKSHQKRKQPRTRWKPCMYRFFRISAIGDLRVRVAEC